MQDDKTLFDRFLGVVVTFFTMGISYLVYSYFGSFVTHAFYLKDQENRWKGFLQLDKKVERILEKVETIEKNINH